MNTPSSQPPPRITVRLPPSLEIATDGQSRLRYSATSVDAVLSTLFEQYPGLRPALEQSPGHLNPQIKLYVNQEEITLLQGLNTTLEDGDILTVAPPFAFDPNL